MKFFLWIRSGNPIASNSCGWISFQLGLFFLPSSAFLAGLFLITAIIFGSFGRVQLFWKDYWNWPFFLAGILMLVGSFKAYSGWLAWVGLANWLPFFWAFWAFQPYLTSALSRRRCALWLVAGTVPVLITGFGQLWFGWVGPWQLFNGLIIWFISPGGEPSGRLSGLFDYANIAGAWLAFVWPFCLAALLQPALTFSNRSILLLNAIANVAALALTDSRNAWGGLILAIPFVLGPARWLWLIPLLIIILLPVALASLPGIGTDIQQWARKIVPESLWARLNDMRYMQQRNLASTRVNQWVTALGFVIERPWLGWGAAAFSVIYPLRTGQWHGHAHNLPVEMAVSHGIPVAILVVGNVIILLIVALQRGVLLPYGLTNSRGLGTNIFDRAWWAATFILVVLHASDIPLFDSRLNIAGWIMLAGMRCLIAPPKSFENINV